MVRLVAEDGARQIRPALRDKLVVVARNDHDDEKLDLDIGFSLTRPSNAGVRLTGDYLLRAGELPAVETMATLVRPGTNAESHSSFGAVGSWIEANQLPDRRAVPRECSWNPSPGRPVFEGAHGGNPVSRGKAGLPSFFVSQRNHHCRNACAFRQPQPAMPIPAGRPNPARSKHAYDSRRSAFRSHQKDHRHGDPEEDRLQVRSGNTGHTRTIRRRTGVRSARPDLIPVDAGRRFYTRRFHRHLPLPRKEAARAADLARRYQRRMPACCGSMPMPAARYSGMSCIRCSPRRSSAPTSSNVPTDKAVVE